MENGANLIEQYTALKKLIRFYKEKLEQYFLKLKNDIGNILDSKKELLLTKEKVLEGRQCAG